MTSWDQEVTRLQAALEDSEGKRHAAEIAVSTMYTDMNGLRQQLKKSIDREMDLDRLLQDAREENARLKGQLKNKYLCTSDDVSDEDLAEAEALPYWYRVAADAQAEIEKYQKEFRHFHISNGRNDACEHCGFDLRNPIHVVDAGLNKDDVT